MTSSDGPPKKQDEPLGLCPRPHPFGATYRLQGLNDDDGPQSPNRKPRHLFCPWCDFDRLRMRDRSNGDFVEPNGGETLVKE